jgi:hypothetical protein
MIIRHYIYRDLTKEGYQIAKIWPMSEPEDVVIKVDNKFYACETQVDEDIYYIDKMKCNEVQGLNHSKPSDFKGAK